MINAIERHVITFRCQTIIYINLTFTDFIGMATVGAVRKQLLHLINIAHSSKEMAEYVENTISRIARIVSIDETRLSTMIPIESLNTQFESIKESAKGQYTQLQFPQMMSVLNAGEQLSVEKDRIQRKLCGFHHQSSEPYRVITSLYGTTIKQGALNDIAKYLAKKYHIPIDRDSKRRKAVLWKWLDDHWLEIEKSIDEFELDPDQGHAHHVEKK